MSERQMETRVGGTSESAVRDLYAALSDRLAHRDADLAVPSGTPALAMLAPDANPAATLSRIVDCPASVDVVITTSGSTTGLGHPVGLCLDAMLASVRATHDRLAGPGQWLTSLPVHHVAGFQVLLRSVVAGIAPVVHVAAGELADEAARLRRDVPRYLSLVPTQLMRVLASEPRALTEFDAILVGGASLSPHLAEAARHVGAHIVTTYGMTETSGGCVYDGVPLEGVEVRLDDGVIELTGPMLAEGYLDGGRSPFVVDDDGSRWLRTSDLGRWVEGPEGRRLEVLGRADDVIVSGGVNVAPQLVENALAGAFGGVWVAVGVPDEEWGEIVVAAAANPPSLERVREAAVHLGAAYRPRGVVALEIPHLPSGKVDRRATARLVREALTAGDGEIRR